MKIDNNGVVREMTEEEVAALLAEISAHLEPGEMQFDEGKETL